MHEAVDGHHTFFAFGNSVDCKACAVIDITADKHVRLCRLIRDRVCLCRAVSVEFDLATFEKIAPLCTLTDCHENILAFDSESVVLVIFWSKTMLFIEDGQALLEDDSFDIALFVLQDFLWTPAVFKLDAFFFAFCNFVLCGRHLVSLLQAEHRHLAVGCTKCRSCDVRCDVAAADDDHVTVKFD